MEQINQYTVLKLLKAFNEKINLWICEDIEGVRYEILTIAKDDGYQRMLNRLLRSEIKPSINIEIEGIQTVLETGFDSINDCLFIVYECLDEFKYLGEKPNLGNAQSIIDLARGLDILKKENRQTFVIDSYQSIRVDAKGNAKLSLIGFFELFKHQGLLNDCLAPNVIEWLSNRKKPRPNFQDDIYSLIKSFEFLLKDNMENDIALQILDKALQEKRTERYSKYHELIELLDKLPVKIRENEERKAIRLSSIVDSDEFESVLQEMNRNIWFKVDDRLSEKDNSITGRFSTRNWSGKFIVDKDGYLFIPYCNNERDDKLIRSNYSFLGDFSFTTYSSNYNCANFFKEKFDEQNRLSEHSSKKSNLVKQWKTLPDKEREYIEESAFKAKYTHCEQPKNSSNIKFFLSEIVKKGWKRLKELKNKKVILFIDDQKIGQILNYSSKANFIEIRDAYCSIDEIPKKGELMEDVRQETSQYKKQVEACDKFQKSDVVNPVLCSIFATPETIAMPHNTFLYEDDYEEFRNSIFNENIKNDTTQLEAVLEAMSHKPVYLIQGPPGTGKTTVIVELIRQILERQKEAKILVTSQSNLAVDNVLEKLDNVNKDEKENFRFMRLASHHALEKDNITNQIVPYTFENKLKNWVTATEQKATAFFQSRFAKQNKHKELIQLYNYFEKSSWDSFYKKLRMSVNYLKRLFEKCNSQKEAKKIFERELGKDFLTLKNIQRDWFAFLGGVTVDDGKDRKKSMLNNGSTEIDFLTAMMREVSIIGATCIHIASSNYSNINFRFDYVIMDESSKASPPETLVPINMGQNIILIGDHKQLPPVITREDAVKKKVKAELEDNGLDFNKDFGVSLFEQIVHAFENDESKQQYIKMLDVQYRMPKQIGELISKYFYDRKLSNPEPSVIPNYDQEKHHGLNFKVETSIVFISTSNRENPSDNDDKYNRSNKCNVDTIKEILEDLNGLYKDNLQKDDPFTIGVIAGYRGQVDLLKRTIQLSNYDNFISNKRSETERGKNKKLIEINTVDKFQGAERDIIIYDLVRSNKGQSIIGFLDDYRRINVAFSRAKRLLIIVGDSNYLIKRAMLHPKSQFKEFKLKLIAEELQEKGLVFSSIKELLL